MKTHILAGLLGTDGYKLGHHEQYPDGTSLVVSNFTARKSKLDGVDTVIVAGVDYAVRLLQEFWDSFFDNDIEKVVARFKRKIESYIRAKVTTEHLVSLHKRGYLPLEVYILPDGTEVAMGTPFFVVHNEEDDPDSFWFTNFVETFLSTEIWKGVTCSTIAHQYRLLFDYYAEKTGAPDWYPSIQGHDFSMRGMSGIEDGAKIGSFHAQHFSGSDTLSSLIFIEENFLGYGPDDDAPFNSVFATEHSVMCAGSKEEERETYRRLMTKVVPSGILSIVSDTWDYWGVLTDIAPSLKSEIMEREGCVVFRPDSGDPVKIICGDPDAPVGSPAFKGSLQILWDEFGGTVNEKGYKQLDSHVGLIYGDSITLIRAYQILSNLEKAGFASSNIVFGIGSFTYQYITRDTFGMAIKATYCTVNGENRLLFKDPVTDNGAGKKSLKGLYKIEEVDGVVTLIEDGLDFKEMSLLPFTKRNLAEEIPKQNYDEIRQRTAANRARILGKGWTPEGMFYAQ